MKWFWTFPIVWTCCFLATKAATLTKATTIINNDDESSSSYFVVAGYLPDYRFYININNTALKLTDLYVFSTDLNPLADKEKMFSHHQNSGLCCLTLHHWQQAHQAVAYKREQGLGNLNLWMTVGGAGRSVGLQTLLLRHPDRIPAVVQGFQDACRELELYGIDVDYQQGLTRGTPEMARFIHFLRTLKQFLHDVNCQLSTTLRPGMWLSREIYNTVDRIHVMAYDHPHAYLEQNVKPAVQACLKEHVPRNKLVLGFPAYARNENNPNQVMTFSEIYDAANDKSGLDDEERAVTETRQIWKSFVLDSPAIVRQKAMFVQQLGLKGMFMWELGQDKQHEWFAPSGFLLQAAADVLTPCQGNDDGNISAANVDHIRHKQEDKKDEL